MYRPVPEDEPWVLDTIEAYDAPTEQWHRGVVVAVGAAVPLPNDTATIRDGLTPGEPTVGYQIQFDDGDGGVFIRQRLRVLEPGGGIQRAREQVAAASEVEDPMVAFRRRCLTLH